MAMRPPISARVAAKSVNRHIAKNIKHYNLKTNGKPPLALIHLNRMKHKNLGHHALKYMHTSKKTDK